MAFVRHGKDIEVFLKRAEEGHNKSPKRSLVLQKSFSLLFYLLFFKIFFFFLLYWPYSFSRLSKKFFLSFFIHLVLVTLTHSSLNVL